MTDYRERENDDHKQERSAVQEKMSNGELRRETPFANGREIAHLMFAHPTF